MSLLSPCTSCARHVRIDAARCPFCGGVPTPHLAPVRPTARAQLTRAAIFASAAILSSACGDTIEYERDDEVVVQPHYTSGGSGHEIVVEEQPPPDPVVVERSGGDVIADPIEGTESDEARRLRLERERQAQEQARADEEERRRREEQMREELEWQHRRGGGCENGVCPPYGAPPTRDELV